METTTRQTERYKTRETATGSQNRLTIGCCFLRVCWKLPWLYHQWFTKTWSVITAQHLLDEFRMLVFPTNHIHRTESEYWWTLNVYGALKDKTSLNLPQLQSNLSFNPTYLISYSISTLLIILLESLKRLSCSTGPLCVNESNLCIETDECLLAAFHCVHMCTYMQRLEPNVWCLPRSLPTYICACLFVSLF